MYYLKLLKVKIITLLCEIRNNCFINIDVKHGIENLKLAFTLKSIFTYLKSHTPNSWDWKFC